MDWSDGASLRDVLNGLPGKKMTPELAAHVCAGVAAGLHAAHELVDEQGHSLGVVHRDVSPQNVLVSTRGQVRLADFGVAKSRGQLHKATETGEVKGKLSYMAPEQVTSKNIDRRADIFALGCVLYEAALGVRPFHGADALATMYKILEEELTPPRAHDPAFPEELSRVLVKALAKDPSERYQTAEELREALVEYLSSTGKFFGDKQVVEVLSATLGPELAERNRAIRSTAERLRRGEKVSPRESPPPPRPHETLTPEGGVERTVTALHQNRRQAWTRLVVAALGAVAVAAAVWGLSPKNGSQPVVAASPVTSAPLPSIPAAVVSPPAASVDGSAPIVTAPEPSSAASGASPGRPRPTGARVTARPPSSASSPTSAAPQPDKTAGRRPRPIDKDNIFATP
jgi:serine/threonine-protein kinase